MLAFAAAQAQILKIAKIKAHVIRWEEQTLPLTCARSRILAEPLFSPEASPKSPVALVAGQALRSKDFEGQGFLEGALPPTTPEAHLYPLSVKAGEHLPEGYDAVLQDPSSLSLTPSEALAHAMSKVRPSGDDFNEGQMLAAPGSLVSPELIMAAASLGIKELKVRRALRVALIQLGSELCHFSESPEPGQIRDCSGPYLQSLLCRPDIELIAQKKIPDDAALFSAEMLRCLELQPDLIVSTGAISPGPRDFIPSSLGDLGAKVLVESVAMRPGKSLLLAEWQKGPLFLGLAGNPVSTALGFRLFAECYLNALHGRPDERVISLPLAAPLSKAVDSCTFFRGAKVIDPKSGELWVRPLVKQGSYQISSLLGADLWIWARAGVEHYEKGQMIEVMPWRFF